MTYSIIARCEKTNRFGVASATFSIACGRRNESIRANIGISKSQAFYLRQVDVLALNMLASGHLPQGIMDSLRNSDEDFEYRQFGIIDREGNIAMHTGSKTKPWSGDYVGHNFAAYGNVLKGPETLQGIVDGFLAHPDLPLDARLLKALEGGRDAGGQAMDGNSIPERSSWLRVVGLHNEPEIDLRVDLHTDAVTELRRIYEVWKQEKSLSS